MVFSSLGFAAFLLAALAAYFLVPRAAQPFALLCANIVFYALSGWQGMVCVGVTCAVTWYAGNRMAARGASGPDGKRRRRAWMIFAVCLNLAILAFAKYAAAAQIFAGSFLLPMGISFYTFKAVSYAVDAYRSKADGAGEQSFLRVALYISFFPEAVQGPISRFGDAQKTMFEPHGFDAGGFAAGGRRVLWGVFKKLVVADRLLPAVYAAGAAPGEYGGAYAGLALLLWAVALYADFTGGIDITIGAARMMGIGVAENFDSPYFARSIADYWRRWHITMGTWFRDYVFYPLSASRLLARFASPVKRAFGTKAGRQFQVCSATMALWLLIGLWHGAAVNFIMWGLVNGTVLLVFQFLCSPWLGRHADGRFFGSRLWGGAQIVLTFLMMAAINAFDIFGGLGAFRAIGSIFADFDLAGFLEGGGVSALGLSFSDCACAAAGVLAMVAVGAVSRRSGRLPALLAGGAAGSLQACLFHCAALIVVVAVFGCYGVGYEAKQFVYNQF